MKHELKVILGPTTHETLVLVDNQPIGLIQDIKFRASVESLIPEIEIVFPNLMPFKATNEVMVTELERTIELLKELPHVKVTIKDIEFETP